MHLIPVALPRITTPNHAPTSVASIVDILWAAALPSDRIEHIVVRVDPSFLHIGVFSLADPFARARRAVDDLIRRALHMSPELRPWASSAAPDDG